MKSPLLKFKDRLGSDEELVLMRLTLIFGATLYPAWAVVYRLWLKDVHDPMWQRVLVGGICMGVFALTWVPGERLRRSIEPLFVLSGWVVTAHIFFLMTMNQMNVSYVLGAFLVVFAVSSSLLSRAHMLLYSAFTCFVALASSTGVVPTPIFVTGVVTVSIIGAGLMTVRLALARRSQARETAKVALESELSFGRRVQQLTMPASLSGQVGGFAYRVVMKPYSHLSGDWSQVFVTGPDVERPTAVIAIGDVVGKGASAALGTTVIASVWRAATARWRQGPIDVPELIQSMNDAVHGVFKGDQNSTLSLIVMRADEVLLYTFGAPQWIIRHDDGAVDKANFRGANPLGYQPVIDVPQPIRLTPRAGDLFVAYTDGVVDSTQARRDFIREVGEVTTPSADQRLDWVEAKAIACSKAQDLEDDFTLVAVHAA